MERSRVLGHPLGGKMMGVGMGASWARGLEKGGGRVVRGQWGRDGVFVVDEPGGGVVLSRGEGVGYMKLDCHEGGGEVQGLHVLDSEVR